MKIVLQLAWAQMARHPARMAITTLAMIAAACVVVWVVGGYDALVAQFDGFVEDYLGRYDLIVAPLSVAGSQNPAAATQPALQLPSSLTDALANDAAVSDATPVCQIRVAAANPTAPPDAELSVGDPSSSRRGRGGPPGKKSPGGGPRGGRGSPGNAARGAAGPAPGRDASPSPSPKPAPMRDSSPMLVAIAVVDPPYRLEKGQWIDPRSSEDRPEAVLSSALAERLQLDVGGEISVKKDDRELKLRIVGIVNQPAQMPMTGGPAGSPPAQTAGPAAMSVYVSVALAESVNRGPLPISYIGVNLKEKNKLGEFRNRWEERFKQSDRVATLIAATDLKTGMEEGMSAQNARTQAYAATGISLLASLFIIFTTVSMGVSERTRQLAMLRAVALERRHIAGLIFVEGLVLAVLGWGGGLLAGWILLAIVGQAKPDLFPNGASLGTWCVLLTGASAFGGSLAASIPSAWRAMRISPLAAMVPQERVRFSRLAVWSTIAGLILIAVNPLLVFVLSMPDQMRFIIYATFGCTSMALGFLLLTPLAILSVERAFSSPIARIFGMHPSLLRMQLTGNLWKTIGATAALTIGLGLYCATVTWGYSMLKPFTPGKWVPNVLVSFQYGGLPEEEIRTVSALRGVVSEQCLPLAVEQPKLAEDITHSQQRATVARQDNVVLIGLDPDIGLGGDKPLLDLEFVQGSRKEAVEKMKQGRWCVVPDHFAWATGLSIGDAFWLVPPEAPEKTVEYKVAGIVSLPGWHWMTKFSGLRRRSGRSAAMIFAPYEDVRRDFQLDKVNFFWFNIDKNTKVEDIGEALRPLADKYMGERQPVNNQGTWEFGAQMFGPSVRISTAEEVTTRINARADGMIWGMCQLPLVTLAVASLGVINTVMASVRARRWEIGVMRALGVSRLGIFLLIMAEGAMIALVACLLSLAFGLMAGWCGAGISQYTSFFGGLKPPLVLPWAQLLIGFAATLSLCLAAALWPAATTGRAEPLRLLQAGRSTM
jgi:putative ABC transport system permease protein